MDMLMHAATLKRKTRSDAKKERYEWSRRKGVDFGECTRASEDIYQETLARITCQGRKTLRSSAQTRALYVSESEKCPDTPPQQIMRSQSSRKRMINFSPERPQAQKFMLTDPEYDAENISQSCNIESSTVVMKSSNIEKPICSDLALSQSDFALSETLEFSTIPSPQTTLPADTNDEEFDGVVCSAKETCSMISDKAWSDGQDLLNFSRESPSKGTELPTDSGVSQSIEPEEITLLSSSEGFTSSSVMEDVGLFNCEYDVDYSGGVYGEGTDGTVVAAMIRGHKVALKKAKPSKGFSQFDAKQRSAVELYYLRRVRNVPGFVQCLGVCDGIDHTCIALEVMNGKLSEYLRRHGQQMKGFQSKRRYTLPFETTKAMIRQICKPMIILHEQLDIAHNDLACRNILLRTPPKGYESDWEPILKLSDFGRVRSREEEPPLFEVPFSFYKNVDIGCFAREILYRLLVGEPIPKEYMQTRSIQNHVEDIVVVDLPSNIHDALGPFKSLFFRCSGWGIRPSFREIQDHLQDLEFFDSIGNSPFPLKPDHPLSQVTKSQTSFSSPVITTTQHRTRKIRIETPSTLTPQFNRKNAKGTVNWLKARSTYRPVGPRKLPIQKLDKCYRTNTSSTQKDELRVTPQSATKASRRSMQILNKITQQHLQKKRGHDG
ncbi:hypothetical protein ABG067_003986 [Albugo candida]